MNGWIRKLGLATGLAILGVGAAGVAPAGAVVPPVQVGCDTTSLAASDLVAHPIPDLGTTTGVVVIAGLGTSIWDVDVLTNLTHSFPGDLDVTIQSPAGTVVTLTTDNGGTNDNIFNGTRWDDQADDPVTDHVFTNGVAEPDLSPEEPLSAFQGENPNGAWTLTVSDDTAVDTGTLNQWSVAITTVDGLFFPVATQWFNEDDVAIPDGPAGTATSTVSVLGLPFVSNVRVLADITHSFPGDLDITLTSPAGSVATLTTDNGGTNDNVFAGQVWDDDADPGSQVPYAGNPQITTDHLYANLTPAGALTPEEPLGLFRGESANGIWTLTVTDDTAVDVGTLHRFGIEVTAFQCSNPGIPEPPAPPPLPEPPPPAPTGHDVEVVAGADRAETAIKVSQASFDGDTAGAVVVARRDDFPDALAGTPLAAAKGGPLLLSSTDALEANVEHELERVLADGGDVYLLGGTAALGPNVANRLAGLGYAVHRIAGENRFATAVAIAEELGSPQTVLEASGLDFPDAVSAGAAAIEAGAAVLLTNGTSQSAATAGYLAANPGATRFAVGGPAAAADPSATGLVGFDRFETSALVATRFFPTPTIAGIASGRSFPDALTGGVQIGVLGGPMLLTEPGDLPAPVTDFLDANFAGIDRVIIYGGANAVSAAVAQEAEEAIS